MEKEDLLTITLAKMDMAQTKTDSQANLLLLGQVLNKNMMQTCKSMEFQFLRGKEMDIIVRKQVLPIWTEA